MSVRADISPLSRLMMRVDAVADGTAHPDGIATGFLSLDRLLGGGVRAGDLVVLGGDVGAGKSALALAIALRARAAGHPVDLVSGEMDMERLLERVLAIEGRASVDDIRAGTLDEQTRAAIGAAAVRLRDQLPRLSRVPAGGVEALVEALRETPPAHDGEGPRLLVVDSLQSIPRGGMPQDEELAAAVLALKRHAVDAGAAVLATAHLPALTRIHPDNRPRLDDFGALGAVKHHADVVLGLYREELYARAPGHEGATELALLKNRNGPTTYVDLYFYKQWVRFEDVMDPE